MQHAIRPMPQATCSKQKIDRGFAAPVGKRAESGISRDINLARAAFGEKVMALTGTPTRSEYLRAIVRSGG
jgi:hypothetical protein